MSTTALTTGTRTGPTFPSAPVRELARQLERALQSRTEQIARADAEYVAALMVSPLPHPRRRALQSRNQKVARADAAYVATVKRALAKATAATSQEEAR